MGQSTINKKLLGICEFQGESGNPFACPNVSFEVDNTDTNAVARLLALSTGWYDNASEIKDLQGHSVDACLGRIDKITANFVKIKNASWKFNWIQRSKYKGQLYVFRK